MASRAEDPNVPAGLTFPEGPVVVEEVHFSDRILSCYAARPHSVDQMLREAVDRNPDGEAIVDGETRLTYRALDGMVDRIGGNLRAAGLKSGDRIALAMGNRLEFISVLLAVIRIGAIAVPINCREQKPGFTYILQHSGARALVFDDAAADRLPDRCDVPDLVCRFAIDGAPGFDCRRFEDLLAECQPIPQTDMAEDDCAVILYTSGTTGRPKGVMLTHLNICHSAMHFEICMELDETDRSMMAVPASHVTGLIANILTMVRVAGCTLVLPAFSAPAFLNLAASERMTHTLIVPAMYNLCQLRADFQDYDLSAWRIGGFGGAPMPEATIASLSEKLPDLVLMNAYGATETASPATIMPKGATVDRPDSVGMAVPCGTIRIVDDDGRPVNPGEAGEIWIGGPMVTPGYWRDPDITAASITQGFWKSGDVGSLDEAGFLRLHDRKKDMIIRGGYNIYSAEVENCLNYHPDIIECAAVAHPDPVLGEKLHVFVYSRGPELSEDVIRSFCAGRLADYKIPDFVTFLDAPLARNANGKIMKAHLRALAIES